MKPDTRAQGGSPARHVAALLLTIVSLVAAAFYFFRAFSSKSEYGARETPAAVGGER